MSSAPRSSRHLQNPHSAIEGGEMTVAHLLAVVSVSDIGVAEPWYRALLGRPADNRPMPGLVEWQVVPGGWLQVYVDPERAGASQVNLAVADLDGHIDEIRVRGLHPGDVVGASKGVRLSAVRDPDGNTVTLIGGFRVDY
jgi:glyoxylase I family protein